DLIKKECHVSHIGLGERSPVRMIGVCQRRTPSRLGPLNQGPLQIAHMRLRQAVVLADEQHDLRPKIFARILIMGDKALKHAVAFAKVYPVLGGMLRIWASEHIHTGTSCLWAARQ